MTTFNDALEILTSSMTENAWEKYNLTWEESQEFNSMVSEIEDSYLLKACEWLVTDWEEDDALQEEYNSTLLMGEMSYSEAGTFGFTSTELELFNSNPDFGVVEEPLPLEMTVGEALTLPNQGEYISKGNVNLPMFWEPEVMILRLCRYEDLSSCLTSVKPQKMEMKV